MSRSRWGIVLGAVGLVILAASLLADRVGLGTVQGVFGWKQIVGAAAGVVLVIAGGWLARRRSAQG